MEMKTEAQITSDSEEISSALNTQTRLFELDMHSLGVTLSEALGADSESLQDLMQLLSLVTADTKHAVDSQNDADHKFLVELVAGARSKLGELENRIKGFTNIIFR